MHSSRLFGKAGTLCVLGLSRQIRVPLGKKVARQKLAAMGKNTLVIKPISTGLTSGSSMYQSIKDVTPSSQIWNAYFVKGALDDLKTEATFTELWDAITSSTFVLTNFQENAAALGMATLTGAAYATSIPPEFNWLWVLMVPINSD